MFLLEHDAKALLAADGVPVPDGVFVTAGSRTVPRDGAGWVVKAQVRAGGRGKQGGIRLAATWAEAETEARLMQGRLISGQPVRAVRIEQQVAAATEAYFSLSVARAEGRIRVMLSASGGVDIEAMHHAGGAVRSALAEPGPERVIRAIGHLASGLEGPVGAALKSAGARLAPLFFARDLLLLEINPLFVFPDGSWCAGDAKIVADDNAVARQTFVTKLLAERPDFYPDEARKAAHGFDYLVLDPEGEIGLLTTGAGLSMLLVDELRGAGLRPYNFLDVRTGGMHGDPARLVQVLKWIAEGSNVRVIFCNIFGGSTDLGGFASLLVRALAEAPVRPMPAVVRLVGNNADSARAILAEAGLAMTSSLDAAVTRLRAVLDGAA
jgi:succinyl-CoA synthetase beta subunit